MPDEVIPDGGALLDGETMRVPERVVILPTGVTVWLRRYTVDDDGRRRWLADGRWCAQRGEMAHWYASPTGMDAESRSASLGAAEWLYRSPHSFATWEAALDAARSAEGLVPA